MSSGQRDPSLRESFNEVATVEPVEFSDYDDLHLLRQGRSSRFSPNVKLAAIMGGVLALFIIVIVIVVVTSSSLSGLPNKRQMIFFGDWGRNGSSAQKATAKAMSNFCARASPPCDYVVSTGDNFYDQGVSSMTDNQWSTSWGSVYSSSLRQIPWIVALGEADHYDNRWFHQRDFSELVEPKYHLPSRFYVNDITFDEFFIRLVVLDTTPFFAKHRVGLNLEFDGSAQKEWLVDALNKGGPRWKIVVGHHPLLAAGTHGAEVAELQAELLPYLTQVPNLLYISGHEDNLQYLNSTVRDNNGNPYFLRQIISGAGSTVGANGPLDSASSSLAFGKEVNGFVALKVDYDKLTITFYDTYDTPIFQQQILAPEQ